MNFDAETSRLLAMFFAGIFIGWVGHTTFEYCWKVTHQ
jgi:hypothetical protein